LKKTKTYFVGLNLFDGTYERFLLKKTCYFFELEKFATKRKEEE